MAGRQEGRTEDRACTVTNQGSSKKSTAVVAPAPAPCCCASWQLAAHLKALPQQLHDLLLLLPAEQRRHSWRPRAFQLILDRLPLCAILLPVPLTPCRLAVPLLLVLVLLVLLVLLLLVLLVLLVLLLLLLLAHAVQADVEGGEGMELEMLIRGCLQGASRSQQGPRGHELTCRWAVRGCWGCFSQLPAACCLLPVREE